MKSLEKARTQAGDSFTKPDTVFKKMNIAPAFNIVPSSFSGLPGLNEIVKQFPKQIAESGAPLVFELSSSVSGFRITCDEAGAKIEFQRPCDAFRAFGSLLAGCCPERGIFEQKCAFDSLGVMIDVSRNAVLRPEALEKLFRSFCLMGINSVQLYIEDVYLLPDEPFFGYARGAYTSEDLRRIDDYGHLLGIEVIPCIQTLGHLEQILQWPAYFPLTDVPGVLLAEDPGTYQLIGKILDTLGGCFRTRTVHIGMDEAHGVGLGRYRKLHGDQCTFEILNSHLQKVSGMCADRGLQPMMWSDMYFRLGSTTNDYYDESARVPVEIIKEIPLNVDMVYWDYYHEDPSFYEEWIDRHRLLGKDPIFASGAWTWGRFWISMDRTMATNSAGMKAAKNKNIRHALITVWGDDGGEFHPFSMLSGIQFFSELAYVDEPNAATLEMRFSISSGGTFSGCILASEIDVIPSLKGLPKLDANFGKWILWHDPVIGFLNPQIPKELPRHYQSLADQLERLAADDASGALRFPALLAKALAGKSQLHLEVRASYRERNREKMRHLLTEILPQTVRHISDLWELHEEVWREWYGPFGWEVIDYRYAGVLSRLRRLGEIMTHCLEEPTARVEEFEYETHRIYPESSYPEMYFTHRRLMTASASS